MLLLIYDGSKTKYGAGLLPLVVGMPVKIQNNIGTELGICNGTMGVITKIELDPRERELVKFNSPNPHYLRYHPISVHVDISQPGTVIHI